MSQISPELDDYLELFRIYGQDLGAIYQEQDDDRYALLFGQVIRLLTPPSPYNLSLLRPFARPRFAMRRAIRRRLPTWASRQTGTSC